MLKSCLAGCLLLLVQTPAIAGNIAKPTVINTAKTSGMPTGENQQITVLTATLKPGDQTPLHTHRFPVTVYVLGGTFTLEMDGREMVSVSAGQSMVEPPNVKMTGYNKSASEDMRVVIFYVSDPDTPFLDRAH